MGVWRSGRKRRAQRALERQLDYQIGKARAIGKALPETLAALGRGTREVRQRLEAFAPIADAARVIEVGCGSTGHIFFFGTKNAVGVDPLADHYRALFPAWYDRARTIAAFGERLPFADASFDVVICDNVVDHAEDPRRIVEEIARVLAPGGLLYFTVNFHHPIYHAAATLHAAWRALGIPFEIRPFADHTVHITSSGARGLFDGLPFQPLAESEIRKPAPRWRANPLGRLFFKNALYRLIARRED